MQLFYSTDIVDDTITLSDDEFRHCIKVLRHKQGDTINIIDGRGSLYTAAINLVAKHHCQAIITGITFFEPKLNNQLHIAFAPTKNTDRTEWAVEKMIEIGVSRISLIHCEHSERKVQKTERLKKIALSAMKQSLKYFMPQIDKLAKFNDFIKGIENKEQNLFIGYCETDATAYLLHKEFTYSDTLVLIGPEGDFSPQEVEIAKNAGFTPISLGKSRLRTETAAMVATALINSTFETDR